jgi:hypothetical protein
MLGNFSFGDYFKREAIHWAWEFLTARNWLNIAPEKLTISVYQDDDEAFRIWADEIGVLPAKITRMGEDDNFWPAGAPTQGPDGVCGPCSEIFYRMPDGSDVEIWNLVFTQFNRKGSPPDNLSPLPSRNIDTGMGLERTCAMLQGVDSNFHIDILRPLVEAVAEVCGRKYEAATDDGRRMRRIADQSHPAFPVTIYYAFKQSETKTESGTASTGWETFLAAVIKAGFALHGTWPMRTELTNRMIGSGTNALASSRHEHLIYSRGILSLELRVHDFELLSFKEKL